ncbi:MAG: single-stranded-DNA-specific exonuclease RecJ [Lachnospiraceae bacterium]|nr:single-stranded-DNA-specific exonuclease RecJ [Lachnospiraceae bacterium]
MAEQNWVIHTKRADFQALGEKFHIDPVVARILVNRGLSETEFENFLHPDLKQLHSPFLMEDMNQAVRIIVHDIEEGHRIRIVSDYDVDGIMSNYILYKGLKRVGADVDYVIPHRVKDGYGINEEIIETAHQENINTILTCDNGIAANAALGKAKELGMMVVVTDHHQVPFSLEGEEKQYILPPADAILNPKKPSCQYPFDDLCGAGVTYKLVEALYQKREIPKEELEQFIEFVAIATVCDMVSLLDENRVFVVEGLKRLNHEAHTGLRALISANALSDKKIETYHIGYKIGPCLNATGRLDSAKSSVELLLEEDTNAAIAKAEQITVVNEERKQMTIREVERAIQFLDTAEAMRVFVIYLKDCHESLAGIIAGRIREQYNHPVFVVTDAGEDGILKGSGRSIEGYHMFEALQNCGDLLLKYGGHAMAAGFSLEKDKLELFTETINEQCMLQEADFVPKVYIDVPMPFSYVNEELIMQLNKLAPFGRRNEKPLFAQKDVNIISIRIMGKDRNVVRVTMESRDGFMAEGIYFNAQEFTENIKNWFGSEEYDKLLHGWLNNVVLNIVYYPTINEYNGNCTIQMQIKRYAMAAVREML